MAKLVIASVMRSHRAPSTTASLLAGTSSPVVYFWKVRINPSRTSAARGASLSVQYRSAWPKFRRYASAGRPGRPVFSRTLRDNSPYRSNSLRLRSISSAARDASRVTPSHSQRSISVCSQPRRPCASNEVAMTESMSAGIGISSVGIDFPAGYLSRRSSIASKSTGLVIVVLAPVQQRREAAPVVGKNPRCRRLRPRVTEHAVPRE